VYVVCHKLIIRNSDYQHMFMIRWKNKRKLKIHDNNLLCKVILITCEILSYRGSQILNCMLIIFTINTLPVLHTTTVSHSFCCVRYANYRRHTVTVKCRTAIIMLFLYLNICLSVDSGSFSCSFTSISFLTKRYTLYIDLNESLVKDGQRISWYIVEEKILCHSHIWESLCDVQFLTTKFKDKSMLITFR
jgi:hypothetical protein